MSTEVLTRKQTIWGGHRTSAKRILQQIEEAIAGHGGDPANNKRLLQLKVSIEEKLKTLNELDREILEMVNEEAVADEIEQRRYYISRLKSFVPNLEALQPDLPRTHLACLALE